MKDNCTVETPLTEAYTCESYGTASGEIAVTVVGYDRDNVRNAISFKLSVDDAARIGQAALYAAAKLNQLHDEAQTRADEARYRPLPEHAGTREI